MNDALEYNKVLLEHQNAVFQQWAFLTRLEFETALAFNKTIVVLVSGALIASLTLQQHIGSLARGWLLASWGFLLSDLLCLIAALLLSQLLQRATRSDYLKVYGSAAAPDPPNEQAITRLRNRIRSQAVWMNVLNILSIVLLFVGLVCFAVFTHQNWEVPTDGAPNPSRHQTAAAQKLHAGRPTVDSLAPHGDTTPTSSPTHTPTLTQPQADSDSTARSPKGGVTAP